MGRLLTAGCSFTFYKWDTWADYLSANFSSFCNRGIPGADNATIARTVTAMAEPDDTVVIMWTSYQRHNFGIGYADTYNYSLNHCGVGHTLKNKHYFVDVFNPYERFLTTLDYAQWVTEDSQLRGYKLYQFCAFPFLTGEMNTPISDDMARLVKEKDYTINNVIEPSLEEFTRLDEKEVDDNHPIPSSQYRFYKEIVCPVIGVTPL